jgi:hypothetical protein
LPENVYAVLKAALTIPDCGATVSDVAAAKTGKIGARPTAAAKVATRERARVIQVS